MTNSKPLAQGGGFPARFYAALNFGLLAFMAAHESGLPVWTNWHIGDATDFAVGAFFASYFTLLALTRKVKP